MPSGRGCPYLYLRGYMSAVRAWLSIPVFEGVHECAVRAWLSIPVFEGVHECRQGVAVHTCI